MNSKKNKYNDNYDRESVLTGVFSSTPATRGENVQLEAKHWGIFDGLRSRKKHRYLAVNFWNDDSVYYYRTEDRSIHRGKVVMVPVSYGPDRPAVVVRAKWYEEGYEPYPLKWTPMITGPARFRDQIKFDLAGMWKSGEKRRERRSSRRVGFLTALFFMDMFFDD